MATTLVMPTSSVEGKKVHPFFAQAQRPQQTTLPEETQLEAVTAVPSTLIVPDIIESPEHNSKRTQKRKSEAPADHDYNEGNSGVIGNTIIGGEEGALAALKSGVSNDVTERTEDDLVPVNPPTSGRRKRRKGSSNSSATSVGLAGYDLPALGESDGMGSSPLPWREQLQVEATSPLIRDELQGQLVPPFVTDSGVIPETSSLPSTPGGRRGSVGSVKANRSSRSSSRSGRSPAPPVLPISHTPIKKKIMRLSATGKLISPTQSQSQPKTVDVVRNEGTNRKRGRKKKQQLIVVLTYKDDDQKRREIGAKINEILSGLVQTSAQPTTKPDGPSKPDPSKPTHPFFLGKPAQKPQPPIITTSGPLNKPESPRARKVVVTPGKLRAEARSLQHRVPFNGFGKAVPVPSISTAYKYPGTTDAPWPWQGISRVLPQHDQLFHVECKSRAKELFLSRLKKKDRPVVVPEEENVIFRLLSSLNRASASLGVTHSDRQESLPNVLRLPTRLLTSAPRIQQMVLDEISDGHNLVASCNGSNQVNISFTLHNSAIQAHPALVSMYKGILTDLTPFDRGTCETQAWSQKYAPTSVAEVLQSCEDINVLRDWLLKSVVSTVEKAINDDSKGKQLQTKAIKHAKKKRKRLDDLDDFIVDEEDSAEGAEHTTFKNVTLLVGPHGSGKTAAVYAVAKELNFEVFELNAGSRRSGKDILDRVGDMTANHLVQGGQNLASVENNTTDDETATRNAEALQRDLESGRQGTMNSFFKAVGATSTKVNPKKQSIAGAMPKPIPPKPNKPQRQQKQSLILLEEVDVLFEEDKQFWATVLSLALSSKRPIILTSTEEAHVHLDPASLHATLEFKPASVDLAADYLLLLAAREGHLLNRQAVTSLYQARKSDLRACIMDLNLWCQMAIGDRKGGLEWMYQRWPPGADVGDDGHTLRVASHGTYLKGMGWLGRDKFFASEHHTLEEETILEQAWEFWDLDPSEWRQGRGISKSISQFDNDQRDKISNLQALERLDFTLGSASAADIFCCRELPTRNKLALDPSLPEISTQARSNYVENSRVIQAEPLTNYCHLAFDMTIQTHSLISKLNNPVSEPHLIDDELSNEDLVTNALLNFQVEKGYEKEVQRKDFSEAFDPLAWEPSTIGSGSLMFTASSFDRPFPILTLDLAPYVRSIVAYDQRLEVERLKMSNLLSAGGTGSKKARTTRAARSALEGGRRNETRRERWFDANLDLNFASVMKTGGSWGGIGGRVRNEECEDTISVRSGGSEMV